MDEPDAPSRSAEEDLGNAPQEALGTPSLGLRLALRLRRPGFLIPLAITVVSLAVHLLRLGSPNEEIPLDERHYIPDARDILEFGTESDTRVPASDGAYVVHPPLAKWFIAAGMQIFGRNSEFGWRFFGAVLGSLGALVLYLLAMRLWGSRRTAAIAGGLLIIEGLWFVQSRVAMLDIYVAFFGLLALWLLVEDRARPHTRFRPWRFASGCCVGLSLASKWGAFPTVALLLILAVVWELGPDLGPRLRAKWESMGPRAEGLPPPRSFEVVAEPVPVAEAALGEDSALWLPADAGLWQAGAAGLWPPGDADGPPAPPDEGETASTVSGEYEQPLVPPPSLRVFRRLAAVVATFLVLPGVVYVATFTPWFVDSHRYLPPRCESKSVLPGWVCYQREVYNFHKDLHKFDDKGKPKHPYYGDVWTWPWIGRPVVHYYRTEGSGKGQRDFEIIGLPNPVIWWTGFAAIAPLSIWAVRRRRRRDPPPDDEVRAPRDPVAGLILAVILANYLPYMLTGFFGRPAFLFYATPMIPALVLAVTHVLHRIGRRRRGEWVVAVYLSLAVLAFAYFYPVLAAAPISHSGTFGWTNRMWLGGLLQGDCRLDPVYAVKKLCWI